MTPSITPMRLRRAALVALCVGVGAGLSACGEDDPGAVSATSTDASDAGGAAGSAGQGGGAGTGAADASADADSDASIDASTDSAIDPDAGDATTDSGGDTSPDAPLSLVCGDALRDPVSEECDDGNASSPPDFCASDCRATDVLLFEKPIAITPKHARRLGHGPHPVAAGAQGFAVVAMQTLPTAALRFRSFDEKGQPKATAIVAENKTVTPSAHPVLAALGGGQYAAVWTDLNGAGDTGQGIALQTVHATTGAVSGITRVNTTTAFGQRDADAVFTGSNLVVAWTDDSKMASSGTDIKVRTFNANLSPQTKELTLAGTAAFEADVSLAAWGNSYAAAYRSVQVTTETVVVRAGAQTWTIPVASAAPSGERPKLSALDKDHALVVFTEGGVTTPAKLMAAIVDRAAPGNVTPFPIAALSPKMSGLGQFEPSLATTQAGVYVAWRSEAPLVSKEAEDTWLKAMTWNALTQTLDTSSVEQALPRQDAHKKGDQRHPKLVATPLGPKGALAVAWDDDGQVFGAQEGTPDVVMALMSDTGRQTSAARRWRMSLLAPLRPCSRPTASSRGAPVFGRCARSTHPLTRARGFAALREWAESAKTRGAVTSPPQEDNR